MDLFLLVVDLFLVVVVLYLVVVAHDHGEIVLSTLHVHLDGDTCMEISALRGHRGALRHYADHVLGMKGVLHGELAIAAETR